MKVTLLKHLWSAIFLFFIIIQVTAQDFHFSQFDRNPLFINPSLAGQSLTNDRLVINYRTQWWTVLNQSYQTGSASYDRHFCLVDESVDFNIGTRFLYDKVGTNGLQSIAGYLSPGITIYLGGKHRYNYNFLSIGFEIGMLSTKVLYGNNLQFDSQFNISNGRFDENLSSQEGIFEEQDAAMDLGVGANFQIGNKTHDTNIGFAISHANRPRLYFTDLGEEVEARLNIKYTLHANSFIKIQGRTKLLPKGIIQFSGKSWQTVVGADLMRDFAKNKGYTNAYVGFLLRFGGYDNKTTTLDAIVLTARYDIERLSIGFSYDINVSPLRIASKTSGAFELSLEYLIPRRKRKCVSCSYKRSSFRNHPF